MQIRLVDDLLHRKVGDEVFILTAASRMHWLRNQSACVLWDRLSAAGSSGTSLQALAVELTRAYAIDRVKAEHDVTAFIEQLAGEGLVVPAPDTSIAPAKDAEIGGSRLAYLTPSITSGDAFERLQLRASSCNEGIFDCDVPCT